MLHLDGSEGVLPAAGDPVLWEKPARDGELSDPTEVGHVTSVALHYELGPIALAVVKRNVDPAATLIVRGAETSLAAAQETIVPTDAGAEANVPRLPRLGAVRRGA
jgi:glycine cleavage system aminomethyltransferase T